MQLTGVWKTMNQNNKISVFGSTGFIGSRFLNENIDKCIPIPRNDRYPQTDNILYFISTTSNYNVFENISLDINTNLNVLVDVLESCKDRDVVFNFISSWFVYGESESLPVSETAHCNPKGFYSITKKCAEDLLVSWCRTFNKKYRIIRLANVYGAGDGDVSKKKNALQYLAEKIKNNENIELYHGGNFVRDYIHVQDAVSAIRLILEKGGLNQTYNVGSGIPHIFSDLIKSMVHITESKSKITSIEPPDFHKVVQVKDMFLDIKKLKNLGFLPTVTIHEGLLEICQN